jgi:hypothetical protein
VDVTNIERLDKGREAHDVGERSECSTNLYLLGRKLFMQVEVLYSIQLCMNCGASLSWSDCALLVAVCILVDLDEFPDECSAGISWVLTGIQDFVGEIVVEIDASNDLVVRVFFAT